MPVTDELRYDQHDGIGLITLNRPQARNALTFSMYERLAEIAAAPGAVRALIFTSTAIRPFTAGTDINQFREFTGTDDALAYEARIDHVPGTLERCPILTIAAIRWCMHHRWRPHNSRARPSNCLDHCPIWVPDCKHPGQLSGNRVKEYVTSG